MTTEGNGDRKPVEVRRRVVGRPGVGVLRVGDLVAGMTKALGIEPCGSCERRRQALNRLEIRL